MLAHLIVLTAIGIVTPRPTFRDTPEPPSLTVQLLPRIARTRTHVPSVAAAAPVRTMASASVLPSPLVPHIPPPNPAAPAAVSPVGAGAGGRIGAGDAPGNFPYEDLQRGVHALLRATVGCSNEEATHLSAAEREACNARFAKEGRKATPFIGIDPLKHAGYDAALQADADRREGTKAQAALKSLQDSREGTGRAVHNDINVGVHCGLKFGPGATASNSSFGCGKAPIGPPP